MPDSVAQAIAAKLLLTQLTNALPPGAQPFLEAEISACRRVSHIVVSRASWL